MQEGHPIAYLSQGFSRINQGRSTYEKECLAILMAVDKWHSYLQHKEFIIGTGQQALQHLGEQKLTTSIQHKSICETDGLVVQNPIQIWQYQCCYLCPVLL
jgi:hypothetical protein